MALAGKPPVTRLAEDWLDSKLSEDGCSIKAKTTANGNRASDVKRERGTQLVTRNRKSLEEQLAETQAKQAQVKARLNELELRRKARDRRMRSHGERVLLRLMLERMRDDSPLMDAVRRFVTIADLRPNEREAVLWLIEAGEAAANGDIAAPMARDVDDS